MLTPMSPNMLLVQLLLVSAIFIDLTAAKHLRHVATCDGTPEEHSGAVLLTLEGDPGWLDANDIAFLEQSYKESLEELEPDPCFEVLDVTIDTSTISRRTLLSNNNERYENNRHLSEGSIQLNFDFLLYFSYQCTDCPTDGVLLQNDGFRRNLQSQSILYILKENKRKMVDRVLPTRSEFNLAFNSKISKNNDLRGKVNGVKAIFELVEKKCDSSLHYLTKDFSISFKGNYKYLEGRNDGKEFNVIEEAVMQAYNTMNMPNPHFCDVHFRKIIEVTYSYATNLDSTSSENDSFDMIFQVVHESKNGHAADLFDTLIDESNVERGEIGDAVVAKPPHITECFCDTTARFERASTTNEFLSALTNILESQSNKHFITDVQRVTVSKSIQL